MALIILACVLSYLIGSTPFSFLIAKSVKNVDIRVVGEGNVGARNVWHVVGKKYGILAGILDVSKGYAAYWIGFLLGLSQPWIWLCGLAAVIGHDFPVFLRGRGGKGAGTALGFLLGMQPLISLALLLAGGVYLVSRNFHLAIGIGMGLIPVLWKTLFQKTWTESLIVTVFLLFLGFKRILDEPHMRRIKQESGW